MQFSCDRDACADGVAIALFARQTKRNRWTEIGHNVFEEAQLWAVAIFENHFQTTVMIKIGQRKSSAVFEAVKTHDTGKI